jgi:hypothetical protein
MSMLPERATGVWTRWSSRFMSTSTSVSIDPFGDNNVLAGTDLDVGDLVRQLVTAALPFGVVCSDECRGLCAACGQSKNAGGGCHCPEMEGDHGEP